jgi:hypothetical protein
MDLGMIIMGENDSFLNCHGGNVEKIDTPAAKQVPEKFIDDMNRLRERFGQNLSGLCIELTLKEMLEIVPRQRARADAYAALIKYLKEEGTSITIKNNRK